MRRGTIIALSVLAVFVVILAIALASVGTRFDTVAIERDDLQFEVGQLEQDMDGITTERDTLKRQTEDQLKAIEQLKAELERTKSAQAAAVSQASSEGTSQVSAPAPASP